MKQRQQSLRGMMLFRRALRERIVTLLKAGQAMIDCDLDGEFMVPTPVAEDERKAFKQYCEDNTPKVAQKAFVEELMRSLQNDNYNSNQFSACLSMLNKLVGELSEFKAQNDEFALNEELEYNSTLESQQDVNDAVELFDNMSSSFNEHQQTEKLKKDEYFSLAYQVPLFLNEKKGEVAAKTFKKYERSFFLLLAHFPQGIDLRKFTKVQTQSVKDMLSSLDKHQNVGKSGGRLTSKTKNGMLSNYHSFFSWLEDDTDIDIRKPFSNVSFSKQKNAPKRLAPFPAARFEIYYRTTLGMAAKQKHFVAMHTGSPS